MLSDKITSENLFMRWFVLLLVAVSGASGWAEEAAELVRDEKPQSVFEAPQIQLAIQDVMQQVLGQAAAGRIDEAEKILVAAIDAADIPAAVGHYNLACVRCARGETDAALEALATAVTEGFADVDTLERDPDLQPLRGLPRFRALGEEVRERAEKARRARIAGEATHKPQPVKDGVAMVTETNTLWLPQLARFAVAHEFPPADPQAEISTQPGPVGDLLRQWRKEGTAGGLQGILYDNHDDDHSNMHYKWFPELSRVEYCDAAKKCRTAMHGIRELHRGLQVIFVHNGPVIGNASVARTQGFIWRSMPRLAMQNAATAALLADQYVNNMMYFYPEHRDYDPEAGGGHGDTYPANVPYVITSQGSSGSDQVFMDAVAATIAAFQPETRRFLIEKRLLMPTIQMIFRSSRKPIATRDDYLSGKAHPPVFDGATLDVERMVRMAHEMKPEQVPPLVRINVESEYLGRPGVDYFEAGHAERLFDTVSAVARVARSAREQRRLVASVAETEDPHGKPVSFVWRLLHGDEARVRITPLDPQGTRAEIIVDWHPRAVYPGSDLPSARVDVGVFAERDDRLSAPAFITWYFPPNERRTYESIPQTAADDRKDAINGDSPRRIVSIERLPTTTAASYADPMILTPTDWTDTYRYNDRGDLLGWTRTRPGGGSEEFTADGRLVVARDAAGQSEKTSAVRYVRTQTSPDTPPVLSEEPETVAP
jgi:hypothetical protein